MYIVIETFDPTFPSIATDENGLPLLFNTETQAKLCANELQEGIIVEI